MYQASTQYNTAIHEDGRTFRAKITIGTEEITDGFRSIKQSARSCGGDYITIGGAVSSCVEVEMWAPSVPLKNQEFDLSIGLVAEGETEWVPMGKFTTTDPKDNDGILTFTAYDRIWSRMSGAYFSELTYPADGKAALAEMAAKTGVPIKTDNLPDGVMIPKREVVSEATVDEEGNETTNITYTTPFDGYTYREALGYIAQFYGKIATANRSGVVELRWYSEADCELRANQYYDDLTKSEQVFSVDSIVCQVGNSTLKVGTGTESISIENPVMAQERLQAVYDQVKDLQYLPASLSFFGDPRLDLCDIVKVYDKAGNLIRLPVMRLAQDFDGGLITQLQSFGGTEQESAQQKGPTAQALDRTYSELFLVKELIGNKASFDYVKANCADINLANIDIAHINQAKINDLYAATGLIKHVTISEGHVTDFLDAVQVNAASITAGTLETDRLLLRGSTGSIVYELNNFGELTSTQVNTIDGYILTDRTINADKIVAHSITANEITAENIIGAHGWINLADGTFNYGNALAWDGYQLTVNAAINAFGGLIISQEDPVLALTDTGEDILTDGGIEVYLTGACILNFAAPNGGDGWGYFNGVKVNIPTFTVNLSSDSFPTGNGYIVKRVNGETYAVWMENSQWKCLKTDETGNAGNWQWVNTTDVVLADYTKGNTVAYNPYIPFKSYQEIQMYSMIGRWASDAISETTTINGGLIATDTILADAINVEDLFSQNITATNLHITGDSTFDGALNGATGSFSGSVTANAGKIGGFNITPSSIYTNYNALLNSTNSANVYIGNDGIGFGKSYLTSAGGATFSGYDGTTTSIEGGNIFFYNGTSELETISILGATGGITCKTITQTSDEREKDILAYDKDALDSLAMSIEPIFFRWIDGNDKHTHIGLGAQSVSARLEECGLKNTGVVVYDEHSDRYSVAYTELQTALFASAQKNRKLIEQLQNRVKELEDQLAQLTA